MAEKRPRGRPSVYTEELVAEILSRLAEGESLTSICRDDHMPAASTVLRWKEDDREGFAEQYAIAREKGYTKMAEDILDIADDGSNDWMEHETARGRIEVVLDREHVMRSRLRVDTRKWLLSKCLPKIYGDKLALTDPDGGPLAFTFRLDTPGNASGNGD